MKRYLVQRNSGGEIYTSLMSGIQLINYIDMDDCHGESYYIYDVGEFGIVEPLHYVGWQPRCLIQIANCEGEIVLEGYGTDH